MKKQFSLLICAFLYLSSCTFEGDEKQVASKNEPKTVIPQTVSPKSSLAHNKSNDKSFDALNRYFEQADSIHREVWRVVADVKLPVGKTPFGKVQRALMSYEEFKLSNKSQFSCDNYSVKKNVKSVSGFPQEGEIFEVCNKREGAKKIASYAASSSREVKVDFYPENLRDILGLGPTVMNKTISCTISASESLQLETLKCAHWNQDQNAAEMLSFTTYDFDKNRKKMITLKGKVFKDLTDIRSIDVVIPQNGKILITETELYAPEEEIKAAVTSPPPLPPKEDDAHADKKMQKNSGQQSGQVVPSVLPQTPPLNYGHEMIPLDVDPDVLNQQQNISPESLPEGYQIPDQGLPQMQNSEDLELPVMDENGELRAR